MVRNTISVKTIFFERAFGVDIDSFNSTEEIDRFLEERRGRKVKVVRIETPLVTRSGSVFGVTKCDIDELVGGALKDWR